MKHTLLFFVFFIITNSYSQTDLIDVPETIKLEYWLTNDWKTSAEITYSFNNKCLVTSAAIQSIGATAKTTITYTSNDLPEETITQILKEDSSTWENQLKTKNSYTNNNLTEILTYQFDENNNTWELLTKELKTYNEANFITENTEQLWDDTNSEWTNFEKTENVYNEDNTLKTIKTSKWNSTTENWNNDTKKTYSYTNNLASTLKTEQWENESWENYRLEQYTYDNNNFLTETLETKWNNEAYEKNTIIYRTNNSWGNPTQLLHQWWNSYSNSWVNGTRESRTYPSCLHLSIEHFIKSELKIYPNPAKNELTINSSTPGLVSITDLNGRLIETFNITNNVTKFGTSKLRNGVYLLIYKNQNSKSTKRLIINK